MSRRDLVALVTVVVIAVPGLAVAQQATTEDSQVVQTETEDATDEATNEATEDESEDAGLAETEEAEEADGHGELVSTLARCLPSGRELHGTGWTRGRIVSQVASTGTFTADDGTTTEVTTPDAAEALCEQVTAMADSAATPGTAKGRPSWAGPDHDDEDVADAEEAPDVEDVEDVETAEVEEDGRGGPPDHAPAKGRRGKG